MMSEPTNEVVPVSQTDTAIQHVNEHGRLPQTWWASEQCWRMMAKLCGQFASSTMVPTDYRNKPENVMVALAAGMPLGLSPLACVQHVAVINGRPTLWGDAVMAQVLSHPSLQRVEETPRGTIEGGDRHWTVSVVRRLPSGLEQVITREFGIADAKRAKLWGKQGPWTAYPDRMLFNRARAFAVRDSFADVLGGVTLAADNDEVVRDVTAQVKSQPITTTVVTESKTAEVVTATKVDSPVDPTTEAPLWDVPRLQWMDEDSPGRRWDVHCRLIDGLAVIQVHNGHDWINFDPDMVEPSVVEHVTGLVRHHYITTLTRRCVDQQLGRIEAMKWVALTLDIDPPKKLNDLSLHQLAVLDDTASRFPPSRDSVTA